MKCICGGPDFEVSTSGITVSGARPVRAMPKGVAQWAPLINQSAYRHGVPPALIAGHMSQESGGNANAVAPDGGLGLMQLMPQTARTLYGDPDITQAMIMRPEINIDLGATYIAQNLRRYGSNVVNAIAAYNAGSAHCGTWSGNPNGSVWGLVEAPGYTSSVIAFTNAALDAGFSWTPSNPSGGVGSTVAKVIGGIILGTIFGVAVAWVRRA